MTVVLLTLKAFATYENLPGKLTHIYVTNISNYFIDPQKLRSQIT